MNKLSCIISAWRPNCLSLIQTEAQMGLHHFNLKAIFMQTQVFEICVENYINFCKRTSFGIMRQKNKRLWGRRIIASLFSFHFYAIPERLYGLRHTESVSSGIFGQRRPTSAQSDQGLRCLLTASLDTTEYRNGDQRPEWYLAHA